MGHQTTTALEQWLQSADVDPGGRALLVGPVASAARECLCRYGMVVAEVGLTLTEQLPDRVDLAMVPSGLAPSQLQAALHAAVVHLRPRGYVAVVGPDDGCPEMPGLERAAHVDGWTFWRRTDRQTVHDLVAAARELVRRVSPHELYELQAAGDSICIIDTRSTIDRDRYGTIEGALHIPRSVLEFHLDPANGYLHDAAPGFDERLVVVCNGGYSSSMAAANLVLIGYSRAADLIGGMAAWTAANLPVVAAGHCHLELPNAFGGCGQPAPTSRA